MTTIYSLCTKTNKYVCIYMYTEARMWCVYIYIHISYLFILVLYVCALTVNIHICRNKPGDKLYIKCTHTYLKHAHTPVCIKGEKDIHNTFDMYIHVCLIYAQDVSL